MGGIHVYIRQLSTHPELIKAGCESEVLCQRCLDKAGDFWFENLKIHQLEGNHLELLTQAFEERTVNLLPEARGQVAREMFPEGAVRDNVRLLTHEFAEFLKSNHVDIIHVHNSYVVFPQVLKNNSLQLAQLQIPVIFSVHSAPFYLFLSEKEHVHLYHFLQECNDVFDVIHAVSRDVQNRLLADVNVKSKLMYIGTDIHLFRPAAKETHLLDIYGLLPRHKIMLYVGRLTREKGLDDFINTVMYLHEYLDDNIIGLIIGDGPYRSSIESMVKKLGIGSIIRLLPPIDYKQLHAYYNLADVFMLFTHREALGLVLLEAMACEKVCIVSDLPAIREVISDGINGFLVGNQDLGKIKQIVNDLFEKRDYRMLTTNARETVVSKFDFDEHVKELLRLYNQVYQEKKT